MTTHNQGENMTTKSLNPRDTTRILNLAKKGVAIASKVAALFAQIADIAQKIDARESKRDPSLKRKWRELQAKSRRVLKAEVKA